jgi:hypothetical protein
MRAAKVEKEMGAVVDSAAGKLKSWVDLSILYPFPLWAKFKDLVKWDRGSYTLSPSFGALV